MWKNAFYIIWLLFVGCICSCRSTVVRDEIREGTWMLGNKVYETINVTIQDTGNTMTAVGLDSRGLVFKFGKLPAANGSYRIVNEPATDDEVKIVAILQDTTEAYVTTGLDDKSAKITFNNGLMTINVPPVEAQHVYDPDKKVTIQALLTEK